MAKNPVGFAITDPVAGWNEADFDDVFIRKDCFLEGGLWIWGCGLRGILGTNSFVSQSSPVQTVSGGTNWKCVSANGSYGVAGIKTDGTLWLWGGGVVGTSGGILGNNTATTCFSSPVQTISGGTDWKKICVGIGSSIAIKTDGTLWLWGDGGGGVLGDNNFISRSSPVQTISGGTNWKQAFLGNNSAGAIKTDGTLWLWGGNFRGELGNDNTIYSSSPVQTISGGTNWKQASGGAFSVAAIKTDGTLWTWGQAYNGQLGNNANDLIHKSSPVQTVSGGTNWKIVEMVNGGGAAIKTDGTLWMWGAGLGGSLGNNAITCRSSPVQTISGGTNWKSVVLSSNTVAAIKTDGTLWLWGCGVAGGIGNSSIVNRSSPVQTISGGTNWRQASVGVNSSAAIREDCW
jgi:alpha-tubulin suppressor-like RCC1 family protein